MTEEAARLWIRERFTVSRETTLSHFEALLRAESEKQNLISASSFEALWERHFVDSAQLVPLAATDGLWVDIGTGAGMPGLVVAALLDQPVLLVEPRAKRAEFLRRAANELGLANVQVEAKRVEAVALPQPAKILSARAVAALPDLLAAAHHLADSSTIWLLPKGRSAHSEVEAAKRTWQGTFHVEPSVTHPDSGIVVAKGVRPK
jgi:16S rRNA (guanine527-N7)-methyltransferase